MKRRIIDLTMPLEEGMQTFPTHWHPFVEITQLGRHGIENRETRKLVLGTHTGTHIDAPRHFVPGGITVDELSLEQLVGPASVLDLTAFDAGEEVDADDLAKALDGRSAERLLMRFDWDRYLGSMSYYKDSPYLSEKAAQWLVDQGCRLVGMDTAMPDNPKHGLNGAKDSPNHKLLLQNGIVLLEYMVNLAALDRPVVELVVAPLKIRGGDGSPVRAFAILEYPEPDFTGWLLEWFRKRAPHIELMSDDNYFTAGAIDSLGVIELIEDIEHSFDVQFTQDDFQDRRFSVVSGLSEMLKEKGSV
jgi:kynurenine formamidase/acyl carrier protein